jgi:crotonobetainyl-CoA:carnitine CoA-transferase CaiB-like acyl-CoA transferase
LRRELAAVFGTRGTEEWLQRLEQAGVPAGPILDIGQMHQDPQTLAREMVLQVPHAVLGAVSTLGHPLKYSATPAAVLRGAPVYGQHTREVLEENGFGDDEVDALLVAGVVVAADVPN